MEFFDNKLCISFRELVDGGIMTVPNYKYMASSGRIKVALVVVERKEMEL